MEVGLTDKGRRVIKSMPYTGPDMMVLDHLHRYGAADLDEIALSTRMDKRVVKQILKTLFRRRLVQRGGGY